MNGARGILLTTFLVCGGSYIFAQQDTIFLDPSTGNYIVKYMGETDQGEDTLIVSNIEPGTKIQPIIDCMVTNAKRRGEFLYKYRIQNGAGSEQNLVRFILDLGKMNVVDHSNKWNKIGGRMMEIKEGKMVYADRWLWTGDQGLEPAWSADGFEIQSSGLPAIQKAYFQGDSRTPSFSGGGPGGELAKRIAALRIFPADYVALETISPIDTPNPFVSSVFLDTLLSSVHQSHELGWINDTRDDDCDQDERAGDGIVKNLSKRLNQTRELIDKDKIGAAKGRLVMFLHKVERLWDRQQKEDKRNRKNPKIVFTSEAYALLKYNGEYLLDHLTEPREGKDGKDKGKEEKRGREK